MVVRRQGYAATSLDDLCAAAGVTKGAFFHHFVSKEALAVAAAAAWTERAAPLFAVPAIAALDDPLDRVLAHIDLRLSMIDGPAEDFTCFVGTMVQESFASSGAIRAACDASLSDYCEALAPDIDAAIARHGVVEGVTALSLARHVQAVLQGAFILAKAAGDPAIARDTVTHLKRYVAMLFARGM
jgi:TetR/AcrR family transcriptional regulator, transcriptional repressor for nem operon